MIGQHRELFAVYWRWADDWLAAALDSGRMWTPLGWQCRTGITEFNTRSIQNFPTQAAGAEMLRIACIWATRHGLGLRAPVHDALLIEAPLERIDADVALLKEIMRRASRVVLRRRGTRAAHRRDDHPLPGSLHRQARRRDLGARAAAAGRVPGANVNTCQRS